MNYNKRIDENFLRADYVDGEVLQHADLNELESVVKTAINANYEDIQKLQDGTLVAENATKFNGATLSKYATETLQNSDTKVPTSMQTKQYVDGAISSIDLSGYASKVYVNEKIDETVAIYDSNGNGIVDNAEKVNNHIVDKDVPSDAKFTDTIYDDTEVRGLISGLDASKVDKVNGKGLSTNDYTDAEKNKLSGIANGAQVNFIEKIKVNGTQQQITNKIVDISVPTQLSQLSDDATHRTVTDSEKQTWNNKGSYSKPSGGIPKTDLASAVQTSLGKADSAIQDVSDKEDKANKVTLLSSSSTDIQYPGAKTVYDSQEAQNEVINALETELENTKEELDRYKLLENALPHITGTGTELTLNNTANAGMTIDLEPTDMEQNTTTGKNKFKTGTLETKTINNVTFTPIYKNGMLQYIDVNGQATSNTYYNFTDSVTLSAGTYKLSGCPSGGNSSTTFALSLYTTRDYGTENTFTISEETTYTPNYIVVFNGYNAQHLKFYPMVRLSTESDTYEPYTNGASPNPDYPQDIHVVSGDNTVKVENKNKLPTSLETLKSRNTTGTWGNNVYSKSGLTIKVNNDNSLVINGTSSESFTFNLCVGETLNAGTYILNGINATNNEATLYVWDTFWNNIAYTTSSKQFTISEDKTYRAGITFGNNKTFNNFEIKPMISTNGGDYVPHEEQVVNIPLGVKNYFNPQKLSQVENYNTYDDNTGLWTVFNSNQYSRSLFYNVVGSQSDRDITKLIYLNAGIYTIKFYDFINNTEVSSEPLEYATFDNDGHLIAKERAGYTHTITIDNNCYLDIRRWGTSGTVQFSKIQIEEGTVAHSYSPYGQEPIEYCKIPNSAYKDQFYLASEKNLFDKNNANLPNPSLYINAGQSKVLSSATNQSIYIPIIGGKTYTVSKVKSDRFVIATTSVIPANAVSIIDVIQDNTATSLTLATSSTAKYLCVYFWRSSDTLTQQQILDSIIINEGKVALKSGKWYLKKNIPEYVVTGNEEWTLDGTNKFRLPYSSFTDRMIFRSSYVGLICNYYKTAGSGDYYIRWRGYNETTISIYNKDISTVKDFKADLQEKYNSGNPVKIKYVLATPEYILLPNNLQEALNTLESKLLAYKDQTNITQVNDDLPFEIVASAIYDMNNLVDRVATLETE